MQSSKIAVTILESVAVGQISNMIFKQAFQGANAQDHADFYAHPCAAEIVEVGHALGFDFPADPGATGDEPPPVAPGGETIPEGNDTVIVTMQADPEALAEHLRALGYSVTMVDPLAPVEPAQTIATIAPVALVEPVEPMPTVTQ